MLLINSMMTTVFPTPAPPKATVDWVIFFGFYGAAFVHRVAGDIEDATHNAFADWHGDGLASIGNLQAAFEALGAGHGDGADALVAKLLLHLQGEVDGLLVHLKLNRERVVDGRDCTLEFDIHYRADDLDDSAFAVIHKVFETNCVSRSW
jgi:hypothetical protein